MSAATWLLRQAARLAALLGLAALLAGVPAGLWHFVGWPLPRTVPTTWAGWERVLTGSFPDQAVVNLLAIALWIVWAAFGYSVWVEWRAARGAAPRRLPVVFSPMQAVAALLVAAIAAGPVAVAVASPAPLPAVVQMHPGPGGAGVLARPADASDRVRLTVVVDPADTRPAISATEVGPVTVGAAQADPLPRFAAAAVDGPLLLRVGETHYTYTVRKHDTLWDIAGAWLGDHSRWPEIYRLNADRYDQHGRMRHGDHIEPGWVLVLPDDATPPAGAAPSPPAGQQPPPPGPPSTQPAPEPTSPVPSAPATTVPSSPPATLPASPDDGVVPPVGAPTGTGSAAASPTPTADAPPSSRSPRAQPPGISLPGGSWVDLGLAAAIAAAATLVWLHRRRRYRPRPPTPALRLDDPDLAPMPDVVMKLRRGVRQALPPQEPLEAAPDGEVDPPPDEVDPDGAGGTPGRQAEHDTDVASLTAGPDAALAPVAPALDHPLLQVWPPAGLGLTGPGGEAAARGFLVAALSADGPHEPEARSRVVVPAATLATLLGAEAVGLADTPRLTVTAGLTEALEVLEAATLHRTRLVYDHEVDTITALRDADPCEEPLPPLLLLADATETHQRARIAALLTQGQRLDIHGVLLGQWQAGDTVHVDGDGTTRPADADAARHGSHPADVGRLAVLDPVQTADLLRTLAEAHTGRRQPPPPVERVPAAVAPTSGGPGPNDDKATRAPPADHPGTPAPLQVAGTDVRDPAEAAAAGPGGDTPAGAAPAPGEPTAASPADAGPVAPAGGPGTGDPAAARPDDAGGVADEPADGHRPGPGRARVFLLGPPRIDNLPPPSRSDPPLRPQSMELLVYLVARGGAASKDQILEDILGNAPQRKAPERLNTYVYNLRRNLKRAGGDATYVAPPEAHYALNRDALDIDVWRMQAAIADADVGTDPQSRIAALRAAVACYTGPLAQNRDYEWIEPYREAVRQQAIDAHLALVAALSDKHPDEAVTVLEAAIGHDPYGEPLYQQAMRLHAKRRDIDAVRRLRRTLTRRMAEIDTEPGDDTLALADQLVTDLQRRPHQPRPLRGDAA